MNYILTIDCGTSSLKAILFDIQGQIIASSLKYYSFETPFLGAIEIEPDILWKAAVESIKDLTDKSYINGKKIKAIIISAQGSTFICLDKNNNEITKAYTWLDNRAFKEAGFIKSEFGIKEIYEKTGEQEVFAGSSSALLLWLKKRKKSIFKEIRKIVYVEDYLIYKLSKIFATEISLLSAGVIYDIIEKKWWHDLLKYVGVNEEYFSNVFEPGSIVSDIDPKVASLLGVGNDVIIITGALDQAAGALGVGNIKKGIISEATGSSLAIVASTGLHPVKDPKMRIPFYYHAIPNNYFLLPWCPTAGILLKWYKDNFYSNDSCSDSVKLFREIDENVSRIPCGSEGLVLLPYFSGSGTPELNSCAKGVFYGLNLKHNKNHFARAIFESVGYVIRENIEVLEDLKIDVKEIRSLGGGSKSRIWNQIKADITNKKIQTFKVLNAANYGVFILAAVSLGFYSTIEDAVFNLIKNDEKILPQEHTIDVYNRYYKLYKQLGKSLKKVYKEFNYS